jgi:hypothetical protein
MDVQEETGSQEAALEEGGQQTGHDTSYKLVEELSSLKDELAELKTANAQFLAGLQKPQQKEEKSFSDAEIQQFAQNPALAAKWFKEQAEQAKAEIRKETQKASWDKNAEEKFPALKTNKDFQKRVISQMREMMAQGEYTADNPMLLYRAAQIASSEFVQKPEANRSQANQLSSVESRGVRSSMDQGKPKIADNDPRVNFLRMMGVNDAKKIEKFKSQLPPYVRSERRSARRLSK